MRTIALIAATTLLTVGLAAPATAADRTIVIHGPDDFAEELTADGDLTVTARSCADLRLPGTPSGAGFYSVLDTNDPDEPLGTSKFGMVLDQNETSTAVGPIALTTTPTTLATWKIRVQSVDGGTTNGGAFALYFPSSTPGADFWKGAVSLNQATGWHTADAAGLSLSWSKYDGGTGELASPPANGTGTVAEFSTANGGNGGGAYVGMAWGCGKQTFVDKYQVGSTGNVATYDFERTLTKTSIAATPAAIVAGRTVAITGAPTTLTGTGFSSAQLTLEQKPFGASAFTPVGTATSTAGGVAVPARILVKPARQTQYRWVYAGGQSSAPSTSPVLTVKVAAGLTIKAPARLTPGKRAKVTGKATPARAGLPVTLQAKVQGKWVTWATGKTKADGSYKLRSAKLAKGRYTVRVISAAAGGLSAGTSPEAKIKVKKPKK